MADRSCRFCGCTDRNACEGGCYWHKPGYCSACREKHLEELVDAACKWPGPTAGAPAPLVSGRPVTLEDGDESLTLLDHLGVTIFHFSQETVFLAPNYDAAELMPLFQPEARAA